MVHCTRVCIDKNKQMWATGGNQSVGSLGRFILETYISFRALHTHNSPAARPADAAASIWLGG